LPKITPDPYPITRSLHDALPIWADMFWHHPELIAEFPEDIILLDWWYEAKDDYQTVDVIAGAGRRFYVCPGSSSWQAQYPRLNRSEEHTSELQSRENLVCRRPLE